MPRKATRKGDGFFRSLARGLALFLAIYVALSIFAMVKDASYNLNTWWIDLHFLPSVIGFIMQGILALALFVFAIISPSRFIAKLPLALTLILFTVFAVINSVEVYLTALSGVIVLGFPIPFSLFIAVAFALLTVAVLSKKQSDETRSVTFSNHLRIAFTMLLSVVLAGVLFPLGQVYCFGKTEYRARVDAIVVLGAQVYPSGDLSPALQDRVDKAIELYAGGSTTTLIMSGGIDVDGTDEAKAMKDYAVENGVPASAIMTDNLGSSTEASAQNVVQIAEQNDFTRIGAVSSYYHMARIKMLFLVNGHDVYTFPATPGKEGSNLVFNTFREIPGWWYFWFGFVFK